MAKILLDSADIPRCSHEYALHGWEETEGGDGIRIDECAPPLTIDLDGPTILDFKVFNPPDVEEIDDSNRIGAAQHNRWIREYGANRYCRHECREKLHQRLQDILVNTMELRPSGKIGLTTDEHWYELMQHVIAELENRGEPPSPTNHHPRVLEARPFFDGELCRKAASVVAAHGTDHEVLVKYGKRKYMEALMHGEVHLNSATKYNEDMHNQAVRDDELLIDFKGGYVRATQPMQFYDVSNPPPESIVDRGIGFRPVYELPELNADQYATGSIQMTTDYWMFCAADVLDQRLFADFEADSCVIAKRRPFSERLLRTSKVQLPNVNRYFGRVGYVDPLGARRGGVPVTRSIPIHMTKVFRYTYQREVRFAFLPTDSKTRLEPKTLEIGPISDIAELVVL
ncbi:MAG: hypothetical protein F4Y86_16845 [Gammaproteobacteria bacterium]|nr:hypothetical protein [Gammaproteobacteria bacterium]